MTNHVIDGTSDSDTPIRADKEVVSTLPLPSVDTDEEYDEENACNPLAEEGTYDESGTSATTTHSSLDSTGARYRRNADNRQTMIPSALYDPYTMCRMVDPVVNAMGDSCDRSSLSHDSTVVDSGNESATLYYPNRALASILKQQRDYEQQQHQQEQERVNVADGDETVTNVDEDDVDAEVPHEIPIPSTNRSNVTVDSETGPDDIIETPNATSLSVIGWYYPTSNSAAVTASRPMLPEAFYCPITCDIMVDPWIGPDGCTYEYHAIQEWLLSSQHRRDDNTSCSPVTREPLTLGQLRPNHNLYELIQREIWLDDPLQRHAAIQQWMDGTSCTERKPRPDHPPPPSSSTGTTSDTTDLPTNNSANSLHTNDNDGLLARFCSNVLIVLALLFVVAVLVFAGMTYILIILIVYLIAAKFYSCGSEGNDRDV